MNDNLEKADELLVEQIRDICERYTYLGGKIDDFKKKVAKTGRTSGVWTARLKRMTAQHEELRKKGELLWTAVFAIREKIEEENDPYYKIVVEKDQFEMIIDSIEYKVLNQSFAIVNSPIVNNDLVNLKAEIIGLRRLN
jgi:hypothetical protein